MENPKIRFKGFTKDWEQRKLGELVKEGILEAPLDGNHGEKHPTSDEYVDSGIPFLMASDIHNGEVNIYSCKYITKERAERLDKGFARNGDVLLTHKATIGETAILSNLMTEYAMLTPQVTYYRIKNEERLNREYLYSFFNSLDFQTELKTKAAQSTRPYIGITAQQNLKIILPAEIDEQIRIGLYFRNLDHLITLHQRKCEQTKKLKKYMLQKMFPRNGAKVPEIRFDGFTYDWEQRKFSELVTIERGGSPRPIDKFITNDENGLNWVKIGDAPEQGNYITQTAEKIRPEGLSKTREVHPGDLILSNSMSFGRPYIMAIDGCIHDGWLAIRDTKKNFDLKFLCTLLGTDGMLNQYKAMAAGSTVNNLNKELVGGTTVAFPMVEEQIKIGDYFTTLDHLITLHQRKCDELKKMKKYMLQNMFI